MSNVIVWGLSIIILGLPLYLVRMTVAVPTTVLEIAIYIVFIMGLVCERQQLKKAGVGIWKQLAGWRGPIFLFLLAAVISVFISNDPKAALGLFKAYFFDPFLVFLLIVAFVKKSADYQKILGAMGLLVIGLGVIAILQYFGWLASPAPWINEIPKRVSSVFEYPNALGLILAPITAIFAGMLLLKKASKLPEKIFSTLVLLSGVTGMSLAVSRGALAGFIGAVVILGLISQYRQWVILVLGIVMIGVLSISPIRNNIFNIAEGQDTSADVHIVLWKGTFRMLEDHWLLGVGLAGFPKLYWEDYRLPQHLEAPLYPHNIILNFWVELGLLGLIAFIWLMVRFFRRGWSLLAQENNRALAGALMAAMLAMIIHGMVDVPYFKNDLAVLTWIILALMIILPNSKMASNLK